MGSAHVALASQRRVSTRLDFAHCFQSCIRNDLPNRCLNGREWLKESTCYLLIHFLNRRSSKTGTDMGDQSILQNGPGRFFTRGPKRECSTQQNQWFPYLVHQLIYKTRGNVQIEPKTLRRLFGENSPSSSLTTSFNNLPEVGQRPFGCQLMLGNSRLQLAPVIF